MMDVLVVDDEPIARLTIEKTLRQGGYNVLTATNGREALELLKQHAIQLVVIDWEMPIMNGIEFCKAVRSEDSRNYIYIILVTGRNQSDDAISGLSVGADDFVTKPFNPNELLMRVNTGRRIIDVESRDMTIFALAKLAESRDPETGAHLERVRRYCCVLARQLQKNAKFQNEVDDNFVRLIYETSPLHDIGKVAIPDNVLLKPGRLTEDEFEIMKTHALHGAETIQALLEQYPNTSSLQMAHDIIISHHEKYDGTGYPQGLAGEQIPLCARIVALADVYDALISKRVYKEAYTHADTRSVILNDSGKHFDPDVVQAYLEVENEFLQIQKAYRDETETAQTGENATLLAGCAFGEVVETAALQ
ncbi:MAG: response regulator [Pirellulales bacterium]|nr:response regulator [Pirellulales bacterium]